MGCDNCTCGDDHIHGMKRTVLTFKGGFLPAEADYVEPDPDDAA